MARPRRRQPSLEFESSSTMSVSPLLKTDEIMTNGEMGYLILVVAAFVIFAAALAWATFRN